MFIVTEYAALIFLLYPTPAFKDNSTNQYRCYRIKERWLPIICKGSGETAHMCKLVWVSTVSWHMMYMYDHWTELCVCAFKWRFAGGPMLARLWWYLDRLSPHQLRRKTLSKSDPLWQNFLDPRKMRKLVWAFTLNRLMMYMYEHWTKLSLTEMKKKKTAFNFDPGEHFLGCLVWRCLSIKINCLP